MDERTYALAKDGELMHYGIKGMKWGVRKKSPRSIDDQKK